MSDSCEGRVGKLDSLGKSVSPNAENSADFIPTFLSFDSSLGKNHHTAVFKYILGNIDYTQMDNVNLNKFDSVCPANLA